MRSKTKKTPPPKKPEVTPAFINSVHCLIFSMVERGIDGDDPWWGQDFRMVRRELEEMGLNTDPEKVIEEVDPVGHQIITDALKRLS